MTSGSLTIGSIADLAAISGSRRGSRGEHHDRRAHRGARIRIERVIIVARGKAVRTAQSCYVHTCYLNMN